MVRHKEQTGHGCISRVDRRDSNLLKLSLVCGWRCWYCGIELLEESATIDHIVPRAKGGSDHLDNLALCCEFCNRAKLDRSVEEFLRWLDFVASPHSFRSPRLAGRQG
jgi:5-methylcytosine-specific restriction endonuclease McrA